jgi:hypothetical protein
MRCIYEADSFGVIQSIYEEDGQWFLKDYEGVVYSFEDVTDDGEVFDANLGWFVKFYLDNDIEIIRSASMEYLNSQNINK